MMTVPTRSRRGLSTFFPVGALVLAALVLQSVPRPAVAQDTADVRDTTDVRDSADARDTTETTDVQRRIAVEGLPQGRATLLDEEGASVGEAWFRHAPSGGLLITLELTDAPPGTHALHVHETGQCQPTFDSAGEHYDPEDGEHGFLREDGRHAGDLPNLHVPSSGELALEIHVADLSLLEEEQNTIFDEDGSALVVHDGADDYWSQPSGDSGSPVACGAIMGAVEP